MSDYYRRRGDIIPLQRRWFNQASCLSRNVLRRSVGARSTGVPASHATSRMPFLVLHYAVCSNTIVYEYGHARAAMSDVNNSYKSRIVSFTCSSTMFTCS